jgi:hypothetical protein
MQRHRFLLQAVPKASCTSIAKNAWRSHNGLLPNNAVVIAPLIAAVRTQEGHVACTLSCSLDPECSIVPHRISNLPLVLPLWIEGRLAAVILTLQALQCNNVLQLPHMARCTCRPPPTCKTGNGQSDCPMLVACVGRKKNMSHVCTIMHMR